MKLGFASTVQNALQKHYYLISVVIVFVLLLLGSYFGFRTLHSHRSPLAISNPPGMIIISNSGSTNTHAYTITVNPDGSGHDSRSGRTLPAHTIDYASLKADILALPNLRFKATCAHPASFGETETVIFNGMTSSDISCPPNAATSTLFTQVVDDTMAAGCYQSRSADCQTYHMEHTGGLDSGVQGSASVIPIPHCTPPAGISPGEEDPCWSQPMAGKFNITTAEGTIITSVNTDSQGAFDVALAPGTYGLVDVTAGSSSQPHRFYDGNTASDYQHWTTAYSFTVTPHQYIEVDPWFDGTTF